MMACECCYNKLVGLPMPAKTSKSCFGGTKTQETETGGKTAVISVCGGQHCHDCGESACYPNPVMMVLSKEKIMSALPLCQGCKDILPTLATFESDLDRILATTVIYAEKVGGPYHNHDTTVPCCACNVNICPVPWLKIKEDIQRERMAFGAWGRAPVLVKDKEGNILQRLCAGCAADSNKCQFCMQFVTENSMMSGGFMDETRFATKMKTLELTLVARHRTPPTEWLFDGGDGANLPRTNFLEYEGPQVKQRGLGRGGMMTQQQQPMAMQQQPMAGMGTGMGPMGMQPGFQSMQQQPMVQPQQMMQPGFGTWGGVGMQPMAMQQQPMTMSAHQQPMIMSGSYPYGGMPATYAGGMPAYGGMVGYGY
uniref:4Fe-4S ferredoxin-type domain-containing protein n=1 Tax=Chromera velia CCMP2878 TaxID=1169474 RepID=A0A0G4G9L0_9ALVE|eukprot:Cvel_20896.t1-p1 / transcript=Cvel_20896.t1 / gene=Cvel_20896 / organism=Chromera_velia_CCMP2878 / gene_product=hypothetical protein / transcript_product=hypothetical protein / location=Cvel_scaffold1916:18349-19924(-) / protein_length=366 / sequence_SO=supercontig / SO=protein_coding / is_pseudo=false